MTPNGFFRVCQDGAGPTFARRTYNKAAFMRAKLIIYYIKQIDSMLPCICPVIDHRGRQNVVRTSVTHSAVASCATFLFLPHFDVICDLLLDRCTATWNLFVKCVLPSLMLLLQSEGSVWLNSWTNIFISNLIMENIWERTYLGANGRGC